MFNWAKKQKLSQGASSKKSSTSKITKVETYQSLHSSHKKLKINRTREAQKSVQKKMEKFIHDPSPLSKGQLTQALNAKFRKKLTLERKMKRKKNQPQISIVFPNFYLNQFCGVLENFRGQKEGRYAVAKTLEGMGLINDLVHDRQLVHELYFQLDSPDVLSLYTYIEIILGGKLDIKEAYYTLTNVLRLDLSLPKAEQIANRSVFSQLSEQFRKNRFNRK